jgi:hypothetical protein
LSKYFYLNEVKAFKVALALLIILEEPYLLAKTSLYPDTAKTFLIAHQAIIQVQADAG